MSQNLVSEKKKVKRGQLFLLIGAIFLVLALISYAILQLWYNIMSVLVVLGGVFCGIACLINYKTYINLLSLKSTRNGMSIGLALLIGVMSLVCVNFLAVRYDKSIDITKNKINSLAEESQKILKNINQKTVFKVFYQGELQAQENLALKYIFSKYKKESSFIKTKFVDAYKDISAQSLLKPEDKGKLVVYAISGDRSERMSPPYQEEQITSALIRLTAKKDQVLYFLTGHGERQNAAAQQVPGQAGMPQAPEAIDLFVQDLREKGFSVSELSFIEKNEVPKDASAVIILGPSQYFVEHELNYLTEYVDAGGKLLLGLDPERPHNLKPLLDKMGVESNQHFVLTKSMAQYQFLTAGARYESGHPVSSSLVDKKAMTFFYGASSFSFNPVVKAYEQQALVYSPSDSYLLKDLKDFKEVFSTEPGERILGASISNAKTRIVLFGDSDFLTNGYYQQGFNRDLALNAVAYIAGNENLTSIRLRLPGVTEITMTRISGNMAVIFSLLGPIVVALFGLILWYRKRGT